MYSFNQISEAFKESEKKLSDFLPKNEKEEEMKIKIYGLFESWHEKSFNYFMKKKVIDVELAFSIPLINPSTNRKVPRMWLGGKIDLILQDEWGNYMPCEHKTTSDSVSVESDYWLNLEMDIQRILYSAYTLSRFKKNNCMIYNVASKPSHRRGKKDVTLHDFAQRLRGALLDRESFMIKEMPVLNGDITSFFKNQVAQSRLIKYAERHQYYPRNPDACRVFGSCEFLPLCSGRDSLPSSSFEERGESKERVTLKNITGNQVVLSPSGLRSFRKCQRHYYLSRVKRIGTIQKSEALIFGTTWHELMETYFTKLKSFNKVKKEENKNAKS